MFFHWFLKVFACRQGPLKDAQNGRFWRALGAQVGPKRVQERVPEVSEKSGRNKYRKFSIFGVPRRAFGAPKMSPKSTFRGPGLRGGPGRAPGSPWSPKMEPKWIQNGAKMEAK